MPLPSPPPSPSPPNTSITLNRRESVLDNFYAFCRRPQWLPLAIMMTMLSVTYISLHDAGRERFEGDDDKGSDGGDGSRGRDAVREAIDAARVSLRRSFDKQNKAEANAEANAEAEAEADACFSRLHASLSSRYVRCIDMKTVTACALLVGFM